MNPSPRWEAQAPLRPGGLECDSPAFLMAAATHEAAHAVHSYAIQGRTLLEASVWRDRSGGWSGCVRAGDPPVDDFQAAVGLLIAQYAELRRLTGDGALPSFPSLLQLDRALAVIADVNPRVAVSLLRHDQIRAIRAIRRAARCEPWASHRLGEFDVYCAVCSSVKVGYRGLEPAIHALADELMRSRLIAGAEAMSLIDRCLGFSNPRVA